MKKLYIPLIFLLMGYGLLAQVPQTISFQGVLLDNGGNPITGTKNLTVRIFDVANDGTAIWTETHLGVELSDEGIYNIFLGSQNPDGFDTLAFTRPYFLELEYSGESLTPRIKLSSSSYILNTNLQDLSDGTLSGLNVDGNALITGDVTGNSFSGDGSGLTSLDGANITDGTIGTSKISGTIAVADGGTGGSTASAARTNLGLKIGQDVQAYNANLDDLADGTLTATKVQYGNYFITSTGTLGQVWGSDGTEAGRWTNQSSINAGQVDGYEGADLDVTALGSEVSGTLAIGNGGTGATTSSAARSNLGLGSLATLSSVSNSNWSGTDLAVTNGGTGASDVTTARTNLGLTIGTDVMAYDADIWEYSDGYFDSDLGISGSMPSVYLSETGICGSFACNDWELFADYNLLYLKIYPPFIGGDKEEFIFSSAYFSPAYDNENSLGRSDLRWTAVYAANGSIQTSDRRLKKNIDNIRYGLNTVNFLRPVSFEWKDTPGKTKLGLIAQEVQPILPEVVDVGDDENKTLGIIYTDLVPVLIKAIQEQQEIIDSQGRNISVLTSENKLLKTELDQVDERLKAIEEVLMLKAEQK